MSGDLKEIAREKAREVLAQFEINSAHVPIEKIIKKHQIFLQYVPFEEDMSGMAFIKDGVSMIAINALHHPNRQRFSVAHELGHHLLHAEELHKEVHVDRGTRILLRDDNASLGIDPLEIQANAFASELLMPRELLIKAFGDQPVDIHDDEKIESLARKLKVSAAALRIRLANLMDDVQA